jgi:hypothetical protein
METYSGFFPEAWQVTLVICPQGSGRARAGFFVREAHEKVQSEASYQCFDLEPMRAAPMTARFAPPEPEPELEVGKLEQAETAEPVQEAAQAASVAQAPSVAQAASEEEGPYYQAAQEAVPQPSRHSDAVRHEERTEPSTWVPRELPPDTLPSFQTDDRLPTHERWLWAIPIVLALGIAAFLLYQRNTPVSSSSIALHASNEAAAVQLAWDASSRAIRDSERGEIEITDGGKTSQVSLNSDQLHAGKMSYLPRSSDVGFVMTVYPASGEPIHDSTRLIAPVFSPPPQPPQLLIPDPPSPEHDALREQVHQLTEDLHKERARTEQLQNLVRILENRLGIQPDARKTEPRR